MSSRLARDDEVEAWNEDGWVLLEGLVDSDEIDAATPDLLDIFPTADQYHADPQGVTEQWLGRPPPSRETYTWPDDGPGFRPEQHRWGARFPVGGSGALNRLYVHPSIVDFAERALRTPDIRLYQAGLSAKYSGLINYEQPMHTDRNHSWLPARSEPEWRHVESFLYLSDVDEGTAPTHLVALRDSVGCSTAVPLLWPTRDPEIYAAERPAKGPRGSLLVYRPDVFHRGVDLTEPNGSRFLLNVSFKRAGHEWVGYDTQQSGSTAPAWVSFVEQCTPRELALFGWPQPGHPIWDAALVAETAVRYPRLDLNPWRAALGLADIEGEGV
jgi:hypothetical protein